MRYIITHTHKKKTGGKLSANQILTFRATKTKTKISFEAIRVSCWPCLLRLIKTSVHRNHSYNPNGFYFYYYFFFALFFVLSKKKRNGLGKVKAYGKQSRKFNSRLRSLLRRGTDVVSADQRTGWTAVEDESLVDFSLLFPSSWNCFSGRHLLAAGWLPVPSPFNCSHFGPCHWRIIDRVIHIGRLLNRTRNRVVYQRIVVTFMVLNCFESNRNDGCYGQKFNLTLDSSKICGGCARL